MRTPILCGKLHMLQYHNPKETTKIQPPNPWFFEQTCLKVQLVNSLNLSTESNNSNGKLSAAGLTCFKLTVPECVELWYPLFLRMSGKHQLILSIACRRSSLWKRNKPTQPSSYTESLVLPLFLMVPRLSVQSSIVYASHRAMAGKAAVRQLHIMFRW